MSVCMDAMVIQAIWDSEAKVWVVSSDNVPGLITEAEDQDQLIGKLQVMVPELLELNDRSFDRTRPLEIVLQFHREERISLPVAA
jgi:hypothetical protein